MQNAIAVVIALRVAAVGFSPAMELWVLVGLTALAVGVARLARSIVSQSAVITLATWTVVQAFLLVDARGAEGSGFGLAAVLGTVAILAGLPVAFERQQPRLERDLRRNIGRIFVVAAAVLGFFALAVQRGTLAPYVTVGWGLLACALFLGGVMARSRTHRLVGLVGLGLCVGRVFLIDLSSTMHRIVAFVVLGLVLLAVGFSYQKFRHLIAADDANGGDEDDKTKPDATKLTP